MRTTINLKGTLLEQAKREAVRRGVTLASLIEDGLRLVLAQSRRRDLRVRFRPESPRLRAGLDRPRPSVELPVCNAGGGVFPGIDLDDGSSLSEVI